MSTGSQDLLKRLHCGVKRAFILYIAWILVKQYALQASCVQDWPFISMLVQAYRTRLMSSTAAFSCPSGHNAFCSL